MNKRKIGNIGENIAQKYLIDKNYKIIATNFYTRKGEIDIVAKENSVVVFVEVKTRTNLKYGTPAMSISYIKKKHLRTTAKIFIHLNKLYNYEIRFDVVEIYIKNGKYKINHIKQIM